MPKGFISNFINDITKYKDSLFNKELSEVDYDLLRYVHGFYTEYYEFYPEKYQFPLNRKLEYFKPIMKGEATVKLDFSNIDKSRYSLTMFECLIDLYSEIQYLFWGAENMEMFYEIYENHASDNFDNYRINGEIILKGPDLSDFLLTEFSKEDILENKISKDIRVGKKRYGKGGKLTRVLSAIADLYSRRAIKDKYVGNFVQSSFPDSVLLTVHPLSGYLAGLISDSCISPGGENEHTGVVYNGYKNTAMFISEEFNWRAFVSFDFEAKKFTTYLGYPRESFSLQFLIKEYFENLGYEFVDGGYFSYPTYFDHRTLFKGYEDREEMNEDAYYDYTEDESVTGVISDEPCIAGIFHDLHNDVSSIDPQVEENNYVWSEYESDYIDYSDADYTELLGTYISTEGTEYFVLNNIDLVRGEFIEMIQDSLSKEEIDDIIGDMNQEDWKLVLQRMLWAHSRRVAAYFIEKGLENNLALRIARDLTDFVAENYT